MVKQILNCREIFKWIVTTKNPNYMKLINSTAGFESSMRTGSHVNTNNMPFCCYCWIEICIYCGLNVTETNRSTKICRKSSVPSKLGKTWIQILNSNLFSSGKKKKSNNFPISLQFIQFILQLVRIMTTLAFTY